MIIIHEVKVLQMLALSARQSCADRIIVNSNEFRVLGQVS